MSDELPRYQRSMAALDQPGQAAGAAERQTFFSDDLGSPFALFAGYQEVSIEEQDSAAQVSQTVRCGPPHTAR